MKIILTEQEIINIVATLSEQDIKLYSSGEFTKWKGEKYYHNDSEEGYIFEYRFDKDGNLKAPISTKKQHIREMCNCGHDYGWHTSNGVCTYADGDEEEEIYCNCNKFQLSTNSVNEPVTWSGRDIYNSKGEIIEKGKSTKKVKRKGTWNRVCLVCGTELEENKIPYNERDEDETDLYCPKCEKYMTGASLISTESEVNSQGNKSQDRRMVSISRSESPPLIESLEDGTNTSDNIAKELNKDYAFGKVSEQGEKHG